MDNSERNDDAENQKTANDIPSNLIHLRRNGKENSDTVQETDGPAAPLRTGQETVADLGSDTVFGLPKKNVEPFTGMKGLGDDTRILSASAPGQTNDTLNARTIVSAPAPSQPGLNDQGARSAGEAGRSSASRLGEVDLTGVTITGSPASTADHAFSFQKTINSADGGVSASAFDVNARTLADALSPSPSRRAGLENQGTRSAGEAGRSSSGLQGDVDLTGVTITGTPAPSGDHAIAFQKTINDADGGVRSSAYDVNARTLADALSSSRSSSANLDSARPKTIPDQAEIEKLWAATITGDLNEGMTLKAAEEPVKEKVGQSTRITVNSRHLEDHTKATEKITVTGRVIGGLDRRSDSKLQPDYEMLDILGEGGMGVVYQARQTSIDRSIALKMIKGEAAKNKDNHAKFLAEASVTGLLEHPNIVPIYDLGEDGSGKLFYSMKHVKGRPWSEEIKNKSLSENLAILDDAANAIAFAHDHGIIHRDLKPENIMLGSYGEVMVMDWGLAAAWRKDAKADLLPVKAPICGTPAYMSPEMAFGDGRLIGPASDVYLLGAILFEILAGAPPHTGKTVLECLRSCATNTIRETTVKGELLDIALHAMKTDPHQRYQTVGELQKAIKTYQEHYDSIQLAERATRDAVEARKIKDYKLFAKSAFGFQEALNLWSGNQEARTGFNRVSLEYAECALSKGDLDLAESQLIAGEADHEALLTRIRGERIVRESSARRMKMLKRAVAVLVLVGVAGTVAAFYKINKEMEIAVKSKLIAEEKTRDAVEANRQRERSQAREGKLRENQWWTFDADEAVRRQQEASARLAWKPQLEIDLGEEVSLSMVLIPAIHDKDNPQNHFVMGSHPDLEKGREGNESLHEVAFQNSWYMASHEFTREQWRRVAGQAWKEQEKKRMEAAGEKGESVMIPGPVGAAISPRLPVSDVSWDDVCNLLLPALQPYAPKGFRFDLPTEAEWEYACRAGTSTTYTHGMDEATLINYAWYNRNSGGKLQVTGGKAPNAWGLYDMHGNIAEWCLDIYDKEYYLKIPDLFTAWTDPLCQEGSQQRVVRGGSFFFMAKNCRTAYRASMHQSHRDANVGIRLVLRTK